MSSKYFFDSLNEKVIIHILESVFANATENERNTYEYTIANANIFALLNARIKTHSVGNSVFDLMSTKLWLHLLINMGLFENQYLFSLSWEKSTKEYQATVIRERRYTSRVHDLLAISQTSSLLSYREYATCLLHHLITKDSSILDRQFLLGEMIDIPVLTNETIKDTIKKAIDEKEVSMMKYWDMRNVTNMYGLFKELEDNVLFDLTYWDTSNVTDMRMLFLHSGIPIRGISYWNTSNVTDMSYLFCYTHLFNEPLFWNTSRVSNMESMFADNEVFNQPLNHWNTSNVTDMSFMFCRAILFNQPLNHWNTSNVQTMEGLFMEASLFNQPLNGWNTSNVIIMTEMFAYATLFNQPLDWDTSKVEDMTQMFHGAKSFHQDIVFETCNTIEEMY
jgi:surface protein